MGCQSAPGWQVENIRDPWGFGEQLDVPVHQPRELSSEILQPDLRVGGGPDLLGVGRWALST